MEIAKRNIELIKLSLVDTDEKEHNFDLKDVHKLSYDMKRNVYTIELEYDDFCRSIEYVTVTKEDWCKVKHLIEECINMEQTDICYTYTYDVHLNEDKK